MEEYNAGNIGNIPTKPLSELLAGKRFELQSRELEYVKDYEYGALLPHDVKALYSLVMLHNPKVILEIGTLFGHTTGRLARYCPNAIVHTVDLPLDFNSDRDASPLKKSEYDLISKRNLNREFIGTPEDSRIIQHYGDTYNWYFSNAEGANFFFIDGSHTFEYCKNDSEKCYDLCKGRGVFIWHDCDYTHPGVCWLLNDWIKLGRDICNITGTWLGYWNSNISS